MLNPQGYIQPLAQSAVPSSVNNGNPNTIYNTPQTGASRPLQGWTVSTPVAANLNLNNTASDGVAMANNMIQANGWVAPYTAGKQAPLFNIPQTAIAPPTTGGGGTTTPAPAPAPTTPAKPDTSNYQWVVMNGKVPAVNQQLYASDPAYKAAWDQAVREHYNQFKKNYTDDSSVAAITQRLKDLYAQYSADTGPTGGTPSPVEGGGVTPGGWLGTSNPTGNTTSNTQNEQWLNDYVNNGGTLVIGNKGWASGTGGDAAKITGAIDTITNSLASLGNKIDGHAVADFFDKITEPFLPGNFYLKELGQVSMQNVLKAAMNAVVPGLGTLAQTILSKIPDSASGVLGQIRDWIKEGKYNELADSVYKNIRKQNEQVLSGGGGGMDASLGGGGWGGGVDIGWWGVPVIDMSYGHGKTGSVTTGEVSNA